MKSPSGWRRTTLKAADVDLFDCEHKTPPAAEQGIPYIAIPEMKQGRLDVSKARLVAERDVPTWNRRVTPQEDDVILSRRTNPGVTAVVPPEFPCILGQNLVILRSQGTIVDQRFLRWLVRGPEWWQQIEKNLNVGAVFDSLRCADIPNFELTIPSLQEQRAIAHILGTLDDKIELNRRMNETLEAIARALFKSWFVDFDPVRAKAEGRETGLPAEIDKMFPDAFEETEAGEIPRGWELKPLDRIADFLNGLALQKFPPTGNGDLPIIKIAELRSGITTKSGRANSTVPQEFVIRDGDILFSWSGSLEVVLWCGGVGALNQHLFKVTSKDYPKWFYYFWLLHHLPEFRFIASNKATTMGHINRGHLTKALVACPPPDLLLAVNPIVAPFLERVVRANLENRQLASIRDTLLPRLLSGDLRLPMEASL